MAGASGCFLTILTPPLVVLFCQEVSDFMPSSSGCLFFVITPMLILLSFQIVSNFILSTAEYFLILLHCYSGPVTLIVCESFCTWFIWMIFSQPLLSFWHCYILSWYVISFQACLGVFQLPHCGSIFLIGCESPNPRSNFVFSHHHHSTLVVVCWQIVSDVMHILSYNHINALPFDFLSKSVTFSHCSLTVIIVHFSHITSGCLSFLYLLHFAYPSNIFKFSRQ